MAGDVAHVDRTQEFRRIVDAVAAEDIDGAQQPGLLSDRVGPLPRPHTKRMRAAIERDADHAGACPARHRLAGRRQPHESGDGIETDFR
ncbi:hypothetical protein G6F65_019567 [Rhizopus arrhizus]|nr:hypothetical protein G6F65_019567 [Rhizopus arrhizus]